MNLLFFWESLNFFWLQSSVFALVNSLHHGKFQRFLSLKKPFLDRFAWNICTHFQVICSWTMFERQNLSETLDHPCVLVLEKMSQKCLIFWPFYFLKNLWGLLLVKRVRWIFSWTRYECSEFIRNTYSFLVALLHSCYRKGAS